jgi:glycerophosphoryl diester phosphodiesterase
MIELDVQLSADGELVVIHDFDLQRTTSGCGAVRTHSLAALRELDAGGWFAPQFCGERILTLLEVFELVGDRADLNVEVKPTAGDEEMIASELVRQLRRLERLEPTIVSCFDFNVLRILRNLEPTLPLGLLTHDPNLSPTFAVARELKARSVHPHWALVSPELVRSAEEAGLQVIVWTVNDVAVMQQLLRCGVDGIISDYPERFREVEAERTG